MEIRFHNFGQIALAEIIAEEIVINNVQDALDIMANVNYQGDTNKIIIYEKNLSPDFFELKTKLAGEILQKFSNYRAQLAIIGDFDRYNSKSLRDFIYESNKGGRIFFLSSLEEAKGKLIAR